MKKLLSIFLALAFVVVFGIGAMAAVTPLCAACDPLPMCDICDNPIADCACACACPCGILDCVCIDECACACTCECEYEEIVQPGPDSGFFARLWNWIVRWIFFGWAR